MPDPINVAALKALVRTVPDFPKPGILFYDITTLLKDRTGTQAPPPVIPDQSPPEDPGMLPLTVPEIRRLLAALQHPHRPGHAVRWLNWRRRHQARSRWFHQRTRLNRDNPWSASQRAAAVRGDPGVRTRF